MRLYTSFNIFCKIYWQCFVTLYQARDVSNYGTVSLESKCF